MNLISRVVQDEWGDYVLMERIRKHPKHHRVSSKEKRRSMKETSLVVQAQKLGLLLKSRTFRDYLKGRISEKEARRIGEITNIRHAYTNYEAYLKAGVDRDIAREMVQGRVNEILSSRRKKT